MDAYDVAVLGGGPGGYAAALRAAMRGARVCCIEKGLIGGTCLNVGCIPSKAMLHASAVAWQIRQAGDLGISAGEPQVDGAVFMTRVKKVVAELRAGVEGLLKGRKVDVIAGQGRLTGRDSIAVDTAEGKVDLNANSIILATGTRVARPVFLPWDSGRILTTDDVTTAEHMPESILIIGGGVTGCEFATVYSELGIPVTVVEMLDRLCPMLDADVSRAIARSLAKRGVKVLTKAKIVEISADTGGVAATLEGGETLTASVALSAVGRKPNLEDVGLEAAGIAVEDGIIPVDERCQTRVEGIYAIGDIASTLQYAHLATRMGIVAADNATGHPAGDDRTVVPSGVYTHPEAATVGLSEADARERHPEARIARFRYMASGIARAYGETEGQVKIIGDDASGRILGAVVIGPHATDVIQEIALAMRHGLTVEQVASTIHPHPSFSEATLEAAEAWLGLPLHMLR